MASGLCLRTQGHGMGPWGLGSAMKRLPVASSPVASLARPTQKLARAPNWSDRQAPLRQKQVSPILPTWVAAAAEADGVVEKGYQLVGVTLLAWGAFILINTTKATELINKVCFTSDVQHLVRIGGAAMLLAATFAYRLQAAVSDNTLNKDSNQRMAGVFCLERIGSAVLKYLAVKEGLALTTGFLAFSYGLPAVLTALYVLAYSRLPIGLSLLNNAWTTLKGLLQPKNKVALGYSAIAGVSILGLLDLIFCRCYAAQSVVSLSGSMKLGPAGNGALAHVGLSLAYVAVAAFNLKEAAEDGTLGSDENKTLNLGLVVFMLAVGALQGLYAYVNKVKPAVGLAFAALVVLFSGYHYVNE